MDATPDQRSPRVIVSIVNWNQFELTLGCLRSLSHVVYPDLQIVVVDNGSRTFPESELRREFPAVEVLRSPANLGYAGAHKLVVEKAVVEGFELIWLLNNDAAVRHDTLDELVQAYRLCGEGIYGSVQLLPGSSCLAPDPIRPVDSRGRPDFTRNLAAHYRTYAAFIREGDIPRPVAWVNGSSMLIPLSVVRRHGFIDEAFFLYGEESDYCLRLYRRGVLTKLVPRSVTFHRHMSSSRDYPDLSRMVGYYQARNSHVVARRYRRTGAYIRFLYAEVRLQALPFLRAARHGRRACRQSAAYYRLLGICDALRGRMGKRFAPEDYLCGVSIARPGRESCADRE